MTPAKTITSPNSRASASTSMASGWTSSGSTRSSSAWTARWKGRRSEVARASNDAVDLLHSLVAASTTEELRRAVDRARQPRTIEVTEGGLKVTKPNPAYAPLDTKLVAVA